MRPRLLPIALLVLATVSAALGVALWITAETGNLNDAIVLGVYFCIAFILAGAGLAMLLGDQD